MKQIKSIIQKNYPYKKALFYKQPNDHKKKSCAFPLPKFIRFLMKLNKIN